jgi:hypothetical protein
MLYCTTGIEPEACMPHKCKSKHKNKLIVKWNVPGTRQYLVGFVRSW